MQLIRAFEGQGRSLYSGGADVPIPFSKTLEPLVLPDAQRLARDAAALVRGHR
jgi:hypothetical protein